MVVIISLLPIVAQQLLRSRDFIVLWWANKARKFTCRIATQSSNDVDSYGIYAHFHLISILFIPGIIGDADNKIKKNLFDKIREMKRSQKRWKMKRNVQNSSSKNIRKEYSLYLILYIL